jgi:hypothetical protein
MSTPGDGLGDAKTLGSSHADKYYAWKLWADKLAVASDARFSDDQKKVLGAISEKEAVKFKILSNIIKFGESSAEYALCKELTGEDDALAQSEKLAEMVHKKMKNETIMNAIVGPSADFADAFKPEGRKVTSGEGIAGALQSLVSALTPA